MAQASWQDCPEAVRTQIEDLAGALSDRLRDRLEAVYLHGPLAMGCFNPSTGDADLLAVVKTSMPLDMMGASAWLLLDVSRRPVPIEMTILCSAHLIP